MNELKDIIEEYKNRVSETNFKPPVDLEILRGIISDMKNMKISIEPLKNIPPNSKIEAILMPFSKKFIIKTKNTNLKKIKNQRERVSICHEFAHILLYDTESYHYEGKCFEIARELLAPKEMLERDENISFFTKAPFVHLNKLCEDYNISREIMAYRLTTDTSLLKDIIITIWEHKNNHISNENYSREDFKIPRISRLSKELAKSFSYYWRQKLYKKMWEEIKKEQKVRKIRNSYAYNELEDSAIKEDIKRRVIEEPPTIPIGKSKKRFCELYIYEWFLNRRVLDIISIAKIKG